jgi:hypothetical protein
MLNASGPCSTAPIEGHDGSLGVVTWQTVQATLNADGRLASHVLDIVAGWACVRRSGHHLCISSP